MAENNTNPMTWPGCGADFVRGNGSERTPPAEVSADTLPSLPQSRNFVHGYGASDMQQYALSAIAPYAEQIKKLERELAERKPASINTLEFQALAGTWCGASQSCDQWTRTIGARQAWEDLIAYIDARPAGTAHKELIEIGNRLANTLGVMSNSLNPATAGFVSRLIEEWRAAAPSLSTGTEESK